MLCLPECCYEMMGIDLGESVGSNSDADNSEDTDAYAFTGAVIANTLAQGPVRWLMLSDGD